MDATILSTTVMQVPLPASPGPERVRHRPIFPPADADAATYRQWIATSPWPEVVFAAAGAR